MTDEYNITLEARVYDFESIEPLGSFSERFLRRVAIEIRAGIKARMTRQVRRS